MLTDNGPEFSASASPRTLAAHEITHHRTPPRSPNHNAVCERFQGTALQECWRPAFHRRRFDRLRQLQAEIDTLARHYNTRRRNHSDFMRGRTPTPSPRHPPQEPSSMTINHRVQLSPRPVARKL